jgi:hypothetical protein
MRGCPCRVDHHAEPRCLYAGQARQLRIEQLGLLGEAKGEITMGVILLIIVLVVIFGGGGGYYTHGAYGNPSFGVGGGIGLALIVLLVLYLLGYLR